MVRLICGLVVATLIIGCTCRHRVASRSLFRQNDMHRKRSMRDHVRPSRLLQKGFPFKFMKRDFGGRNVAAMSASHLHSRVKRRAAREFEVDRRGRSGTRRARKTLRSYLPSKKGKMKKRKSLRVPPVRTKKWGDITGEIEKPRKIRHQRGEKREEAEDPNKGYQSRTTRRKIKKERKGLMRKDRKSENKRRRADKKKKREVAKGFRWIKKKELTRLNDTDCKEADRTSWLRLSQCIGRSDLPLESDPKEDCKYRHKFLQCMDEISKDKLPKCTGGPSLKKICAEECGAFIKEVRSNLRRRWTETSCIIERVEKGTKNIANPTSGQLKKP